MSSFTTVMLLVYSWLVCFMEILSSRVRLDGTAGSECCFFSAGAWIVWSHPDHRRGETGDGAHRDHQELCFTRQSGWRVHAYYTGGHDSLWWRLHFKRLFSRHFNNSLLQGHIDELWGLAVHPWKSQFLTCGYDRQVCLWDSNTHQLIWTKSLEVSWTNTAPLRSFMENYKWWLGGIIVLENKNCAFKKTKNILLNKTGLFVTFCLFLF